MNKEIKKMIIKKWNNVNLILVIVGMLLIILPILIFLICLSISGITLGKIYLMDWYMDFFVENNPVQFLSLCWGIFLLILSGIIGTITWWCSNE